jgi:hypothetical protein
LPLEHQFQCEFIKRQRRLPQQQNCHVMTPPLAPQSSA